MHTRHFAPMRPNPGAGVEATSVGSYFGDPLRLHVNVGAFPDARGDNDELGHKASLLGELIVGPVRPGLELTMKAVRGEDAQVAAAGGAIWNLGLVDLRAGLHFGVTEAAPDLRASLWVSSKYSLVHFRRPTTNALRASVPRGESSPPPASASQWHFRALGAIRFATRNHERAHG